MGLLPVGVSVSQARGQHFYLTAARLSAGLNLGRRSVPNLTEKRRSAITSTEFCLKALGGSQTENGRIAENGQLRNYLRLNLKVGDLNVVHDYGPVLQRNLQIISHRCYRGRLRCRSLSGASFGYSWVLRD